MNVWEQGKLVDGRQILNTRVLVKFKDNLLSEICLLSESHKEGTQKVAVKLFTTQHVSQAGIFQS